MTGWERWSTLNCAGDWSLTLRQIAYPQTKIHRRESDALYSLGFGDTNGSPNPDQINKKKKKKIDQMISVKELAV